MGIYNPYSLTQALGTGEISNYCAASGATNLLPKFVSNMALRLQQFNHCTIMRQTLGTSDLTSDSAELFLYQSGYLNIVENDEFGYILGFPNEEVRQALNEVVLPVLTMRTNNDTQSLQGALLRLLCLGLDENVKGLLDWMTVSGTGDSMG